MIEDVIGQTTITAGGGGQAAKIDLANVSNRDRSQSGVSYVFVGERRNPVYIVSDAGATQGLQVPQNTDFISGPWGARFDGDTGNFQYLYANTPTEVTVLVVTSADSNNGFIHQPLQGNSDRLTDQDVRATQFGELRTTDKNIQSYVQGRYRPDELRERIQTTGDAAVNDDTTAAIVSSGTDANASVRIETRQFLNYAPSDLFEYSQFIHAPTGVADDQTLIAGLQRAGDGVFFRLTPNDADLVVQSSIGGTTNSRRLRDIDSSATIYGLDRDVTPEIFTKQSVLVIYGGFYGWSQIVFALRESLQMNPRFPGRTETILGVYDPTRDPEFENAQPGSQYMRTCNLPATVELKNNGTSPASSTDVHVGDVQIGVFGASPRDPTRLRFKFRDLSVSQGAGFADSEIMLALRKRDLYRGAPTDVNIVIAEVKVIVDGGSNRLDWDVVRDIESVSGTFDDNPYSTKESALEIGLGTNQTNGDVTGDITAGTPTDGDITAVGSQGSAEPNEGERAAQQPIGIDEVAAIVGHGVDGSSTFDLIVWVEEAH